MDAEKCWAYIPCSLYCLVFLANMALPPTATLLGRSLWADVREALRMSKLRLWLTTHSRGYSGAAIVPSYKSLAPTSLSMPHALSPVWKRDQCRSPTNNQIEITPFHHLSYTVVSEFTSLVPSLTHKGERLVWLCECNFLSLTPLRARISGSTNQIVARSWRYLSTWEMLSDSKWAYYQYHWAFHFCTAQTVVVKMRGNMTKAEAFTCSSWKWYVKGLCRERAPWEH